MRFILSITAALIVVGGGLAACQTTSGNPIEKIAGNTATTTATVAEARRISLDDAKKAFDDGTALFIDTRGEAQYKEEHIKGAINIPSEAVESRLSEISKDKKVIAYCS